jgi:hypothetical protein
MLSKICNSSGSCSIHKVRTSSTRGPPRKFTCLDTRWGSCSQTVYRCQWAARPDLACSGIDDGVPSGLENSDFHTGVSSSGPSFCEG